MIKLVDHPKLLTQFIDFPKILYKNHKQYVFPLFMMQKRELSKLIFKDKTYKALLFIENQKVLGRVLFTYDHSKHKGMKVCYFSHLDMTDDISVTKALFDYIYQDMKENNVTYIEGTFSPYDPDTRRGILLNDFESEPVLFTSYNYPYYQKHLESLDFIKAFDTLLLNGGDINDKNLKMLKRIYDYSTSNYQIKIDYLDTKHIEEEIDDIYEVIKSSHHDILYQEPPTKEMLYDAFIQMKSLINNEFSVIARHKETNKPVGFAFVLPDYNQVIKKAKGNILLFPFISKKKINRAIGKLQYVIPAYQDLGIMPSMYFMINLSLIKYKIKTIEMGTIMEDNYKSFNHFLRFGGSIKKTYRIYGKEINL